MPEITHRASVSHPEVQGILAPLVTFDDASKRLLTYTHEKIHPRHRNWHVHDDPERGIISIRYEIQDAPRARWYLVASPIVQYNGDGYIVPIIMAPQSLANRSDRTKYDDMIKTLSSPENPNRWGQARVSDIAGDFWNYIEGELLTDRLLTFQEPSQWVGFKVHEHVFPEEDKLKVLLKTGAIMPVRHVYGMHWNQDIVRQVAIAEALGIDLYDRVTQIESLLVEKLSDSALDRVRNSVSSIEQRGTSIAQYNRAVRRGDSLDAVRNYQSGIHALYNLIYESELVRRRSPRTSYEAHQNFLGADDKTAIATVKFAIGDVLTKGQWKHLTRLTPQATADLVRRGHIDDIFLKDRHRPGWLSTEPATRWNRDPNDDPDSQWAKRPWVKKLVEWHQLKLGTNDSRRDRQLREALERRVLRPHDYHLRGGRVVRGGYARHPQEIDPEEMERRRENFVTSMEAAFRAYQNASDKEIEQIQESLNDAAEGDFGEVTAYRFLSLVSDWLNDIRPVLDKNQLKAPISWWHQQQMAWHEAQNRVPGLYEHHPLNRRQELSLKWEAPLDQDMIPLGNIKNAEHSHVRAVALTSARALQDEGRAMSHCVGSYARRCYEGRTLIYSLTDPKGEERLATLELRHTPDGTWVKGQCLSKYNRVPPEYVKKAASKFVKRFNKALAQLEEQDQDAAQVAA